MHTLAKVSLELPALSESTSRGMPMQLAIVEILDGFQQHKGRSRILIQSKIESNSSLMDRKPRIHFLRINK